MAEQQRGVYVGLAVAVALVVLTATGVAVARLGARHVDRRRQVAIASPTTPSHQATPATPLPDITPPVSAVIGSHAEVVSPTRVRRSQRPAAGVAHRAAGNAEASLPTPSSAPFGVGAPAGAGSDHDPPPARPPSSPSTSQPLLAASVSAGQGAAGGVVGIALHPDPDIDLTVGTTPLVGDAPPSQRTEITLGGQLFQPPLTIPVLSGPSST